MAFYSWCDRHKVVVCALMMIAVFSFMAYGLSTDAKAFEPVTGTVTTLELGLVVAALIAAGLTFASTGSAQQAGQAFIQACPEAAHRMVVEGHLVYRAVTNGYKYVSDVASDVWSTVRSWVDTNYNAGENYTAGEASNTVLNDRTTYYITNFDYTSVSSIVSSLPSGFQKIITTDSINFTNAKWIIADYYPYSNGERVWYDIYLSSSDSIYYYNNTINGNFILYSGWGYGTTPDHVSYYPNVGVGASTVTMNKSGAMYYYNLQTISQTALGITGSDGVDQDSRDYTNTSVGSRSVGVDLVGVADDSTDVVGTLNDGTKVGVADEVLDDVVGLTSEQEAAADLTGVPVDSAVDEPADSAADESQDATNAAAADESSTSIKGMIWTVFPFCLPWDLKNAFSLIAQQAEAPAFTVDFCAPLTNIPWKGSTAITFDFSNYSVVGQVCRWVFTIEFCIGLMILTRKIIHS